METSLRYGGDSSVFKTTQSAKPQKPTARYAAADATGSGLKIHAKQKLRIDSNTQLQLNGELDTRTGAPTYFCALLRHFFTDLSASLGAGMKYDRSDKLHYTVRGKKAFPMRPDQFVNFVIKGQCDVDKEFAKPTPSGAAELVWNILDFQKEQDVRLKVGYEIVNKIPYVQIRENNWTFNVDTTGRWNVRYNL